MSFLVSELNPVAFEVKLNSEVRNGMHLGFYSHFRPNNNRYVYNKVMLAMFGMTILHSWNIYINFGLHTKIEHTRYYIEIGNIRF